MVPAKFFKSQDYRDLIQMCLKDSVVAKKRTFSQAADFCHVQATYFSNVLKGRADFSDDQIFSICEFLELNENEAHYLRLCHQWSRSGLKERKAELQKKIVELRELALSPAARLRVDAVNKVKSEDEFIYFLDPMHQVLALSLELVSDKKDLKKIQETLMLSEDRLHSLIESLIQSGRIRLEGNLFKKSPLKYHLGTDSKVLFQHQASIRQMSVEKMRQLKRKDFKAFSVTFGASKKEKAEIEEVLNEALEKIRKINEKSEHKEDSVYQINLDFFPWLSL